MIIGITGNSGAGKTTVANILAKKIDAEIIDADKIVKEEQKKGKPYYMEIVKNMGEEILLENLDICRKKLATILYKNEEKRNKINEITNKYIVPIIIEKAKKSTKQNIILDVPLLFESGLDKYCDKTISVLAEEKIKIERIHLREKIERDTIIQRLNIQAKNEYYIKKSDYIIENNNKDLEGKVEGVWKNICTNHGKN